MAVVEIRIPYDKIQNSQTITQVQRRAYKRAGVNMSRNEVVELIDDSKRRERIIKVKRSVEYYFQGKHR